MSRKGDSSRTPPNRSASPERRLSGSTATRRQAPSVEGPAQGRHKTLSSSIACVQHSLDAASAAGVSSSSSDISQIKGQTMHRWPQNAGFKQSGNPQQHAESKAQRLKNIVLTGWNQAVSMTEPTVRSQRKASMLATASGLPLQLSPYLDQLGKAFRATRSLAECQCQHLPGYLRCCFLHLSARFWVLCKASNVHTRAVSHFSFIEHLLERVISMITAFSAKSCVALNVLRHEVILIR